MGNPRGIYHAGAIAALVLALPSTSHARERLWATLGVNDDGTEVWLDFSSISKEPPVEILRPFEARTAWVRFDYSQNRNVSARELLQHVAFDCHTDRHVALQSIMRDPNGHVMASADKADMAIFYKATVPDSMMAQVADWVCKQK